MHLLGSRREIWALVSDSGHGLGAMGTGDTTTPTLTPSGGGGGLNYTSGTYSAAPGGLGGGGTGAIYNKVYQETHITLNT